MKKKVAYVGNNILMPTNKETKKKSGRRKVEQWEIDRCLRCSKPVSECTGKCKF